MAPKKDPGDDARDDKQSVFLADEARDDQETGPGDMFPAEVNELMELAEDENERLAEATRPAAMPVAQRLHIGNGEWIDVGVIGTPSEKRLDYVDRKW